jgi:hypothetical protein
MLTEFNPLQSHNQQVIAQQVMTLQSHNHQIMVLQRASRIDHAVELLLQMGYEENESRLYVEDTIQFQGRKFVGKRARQLLVDAVAQRIDAKSPLSTHSTTHIASAPALSSKKRDKNIGKKRQPVLQGDTGDLQGLRSSQVSKPAKKSSKASKKSSKAAKKSHTNLPHMEWPCAPKPDARCLAGCCENEPVAHFSCSHDFCSDCLVGIRRHQKKKKPEAGKLYAPPPPSLLFLSNPFADFVSHTWCLLVLLYFTAPRRLAANQIQAAG